MDHLLEGHKDLKWTAHDTPVGGGGTGHVDDVVHSVCVSSVHPEVSRDGAGGACGRGLHSSTFQLNLSALFGIRGCA